MYFLRKNSESVPRSGAVGVSQETNAGSCELNELTFPLSRFGCFTLSTNGGDDFEHITHGPLHDCRSLVFGSSIPW